MLNSLWNWFGIFLWFLSITGKYELYNWTIMICNSCILRTYEGPNLIRYNPWYNTRSPVPFLLIPTPSPLRQGNRKRHMACTGRSAKGFRQMGQPQMVCLWFGRCCDTGNDSHSTCKTILVIKIFQEYTQSSWQKLQHGRKGTNLHSRRDCISSQQRRLLDVANCAR